MYLPKNLGDITMESSSKCLLESDSETDLINRDAHRQFMETANQLIETTRTKLNYMQGLSEDLSEMASLIKDERKENKQAGKHNTKQKRTNKDTKNSYDIVIPVAPDIESPTPEPHQNQSPRNKKNKKNATKEKDTGTGKNVKNNGDVKSTIVPVTDAKLDVSSGTPHDSVEKKPAKGKTTQGHAKHKRGKKTTGTLKAVKEHNKEKTENRHSDSDKNGKRTTNRATSNKKHPTPKPKRHCCAQHSRIFTGPVLFADSHEQFRHIQLPALLRTTTLMSPRPKSELNDRRYFNKEHSDFREIATAGPMKQDVDFRSSCEDDIMKPTKIGCDRFRNNCLHDFDKKNIEHFGKRDVLTPNKVTIQSTGFTRMLTEASFLPVDEISIKFRLRFGQHKPVFPLNLNLHKLFGDKTRYSYGFDKIDGKLNQNSKAT